MQQITPTHGHWEEGAGYDYRGRKVYDSLDCSACKGIVKVEFSEKRHLKESFKYCPYCGVPMCEETRLKEEKLWM